MKKLLTLVFLSVFLAACGTAASQPTTTPAVGFTQPQWGSGFQQPQWGNGWNQTQPSEEQVSQEAVATQSQDGVKTIKIDKVLGELLWLFATVFAMVLFVICITWLVTRSIAKVFDTHTFGDYHTWLQVLISVVDLVISVVVGFLIWRGTEFPQIELPRLNGWLVVWVVEISLFTWLVIFGATRIIASAFEWPRFMTYPRWAKILIFVAAAIMTLVFSFVFWKQAGGGGPDQWRLVNLVIGIECWAWFLSRIAYWILKSIRGKAEKHQQAILDLAAEVEAAEDRLEKEKNKNPVRQQTASLAKKLQVVQEKLDAKKDKLEDLDNQRGDQARRLGRGIDETEAEIEKFNRELGELPALVPSRIEVLLQAEFDRVSGEFKKASDPVGETRLSDDALDLNHDSGLDEDGLGMNILEAMMAPWMFTLGRLSKKNRNLIHGRAIDFPDWLWGVDFVILLVLYLWLGNPFGWIFMIIAIATVILWLLAQIPVVGVFFKGLLKILFKVVGDVAEMEFHAVRTVEKFRATVKEGSQKS